MKKTKSIIALFLFATLLFTFCKKQDPEPEPEPTPVAPPPAGLSVNSTPQAEFTLDGTTYTYVVGKDTVANLRTNDKLAVGTSTSATYHSSFTKTGKYPKTYIKFTKNLLTYIGNPTPAELSFKNFFSVGDVPYMTPDPTYGMRITYIDANGVEWATDKGIRDQSTSNFKIKEVKEVKLAYQEMVVYATYDCMLYDGTGKVKALTNGKFVGNFENK